MAVFCSIAMAGAETLDQIHIGFFQALKKLPGIGGQRFDIAALAFGIQGVEGQGGFTGPGQTGDHHQLVARQTKADVFEVVLPGPFDIDGVYGRHGIGSVDGMRFMIKVVRRLWGGGQAVQPSGLVCCQGDGRHHALR
jgi:hypothetical protein